MGHIDLITISMVISGGAFIGMLSRPKRKSEVQKRDEELMDFYFRLGNKVPSQHFNDRLKDIEGRLTRYFDRTSTKD